MDPLSAVEKFSGGEWHVTRSGVQLNRKAYQGGLQGIMMNGKGVVQEGSIVRGDLAKIHLGKYCTVGKEATLHPVFYLRPQGCAPAPASARPGFRPPLTSVLNIMR